MRKSKRSISTIVTLEFGKVFDMVHGAPPRVLPEPVWRGKARVVYNDDSHSACWFCDHKHRTAEAALRCATKRLFKEER